VIAEKACAKSRQDAKAAKEESNRSLALLANLGELGAK
jgi:hypothetical protein